MPSPSPLPPETPLAHGAPARAAARSLRIALLTLLGLGVAFALGGFGLSAKWFRGDGVMLVLILLGLIAVGMVLLLGWTAFQLGRTRANRSPLWARAGAAAVLAALGASASLALMDVNAVWSIAIGLPAMLLVLIGGPFTAGSAPGRVFGLPRDVYAWAGILSVPAGIAWIAYMFTGPGYYAEFNHIKAHLAAIPGVRIVQMGGNRDMTYEDIWARLHVEGKGEITLHSLTRDSLVNSSDLHVSKIDRFSFRKERWGYGAVIDREGKPVWHQSMGFTLNLGRTGDFSPSGKLYGKLPARIRNVRELIEHYDEICAVLRALDGEKLFFQNDDGSTLEFTVQTGDRRGRRPRNV